MLKKDDIVIYGSHGVCKIVEIGALDIGPSDKNQRYYTIRPVGRTDTVFYLPVDSNKTAMRKVISKNEAEQLIAEIPDIEPVWVENQKEREEQYKQALKSCDCKEIIKIIKTLYGFKKQREVNGKKMTAVDERYFKLAKEQLYSELSFVLSVDKNKIEDYITQNVREK